MNKYKKKPIIVEALKFNGSNVNEVRHFCGSSCTVFGYGLEEILPSKHYSQIIIHTLEGDMKVSNNDYIIKGIKGEFYPCKPDIFEQTYELVN